MNDGLETLIFRDSLDNETGDHANFSPRLLWFNFRHEEAHFRICFGNSLKKSQERKARPKNWQKYSVYDLNGYCLLHNTEFSDFIGGQHNPRAIPLSFEFRTRSSFPI